LKKTVFLFLLVMMFFPPLWAKGVKAGTVITNQAILNFSIGNSISYTVKSNEVKSIVMQVLDLILQWQDSKPVELYQGAKKKVITLSLLNNGNGKDKISLYFNENSSVSSDIESMNLYIDSNKNGVFDNEDKVVTNVVLDEDKYENIFLVTSLKDNALIEEDSLNVEVKAKSDIGGSGIKGTFYQGKGVGGVDAVDGVSGGVAIQNVVYSLVYQNPSFKKSVKYFEGGDYFLVSLNLNIEGNANLKNIHIEDEVPKGLFYRRNSIRLNQKLQTDQKDDDNAYFDFNLNRLALDFPSAKLPKKFLVTYILDKEAR